MGDIMKIWRDYRKIPLETIDNLAFWQRLNNLLKSKKITHEEVAYKIGINHPTFRNWSHRKVCPDIEYIYYIAQVLNTTINYLIFGKENEPENKTNILIGNSVLELVNLIKNAVNE